VSDQELRKGIRILVSGGASVLEDETLDKVTDCCDEVRKERNPTALSRSDAEYLQDILRISEEFIQAKISALGARKEIAELNERYPDVATHIKKKDVAVPRGIYLEYIGEDVYESGYVDEGWMPSRICLG